MECSPKHAETRVFTGSRPSLYERIRSRFGRVWRCMDCFHRKNPGSFGTPSALASLKSLKSWYHIIQPQNSVTPAWEANKKENNVRNFVCEERSPSKSSVEEFINLNAPNLNAFNSARMIFLRKEKQLSFFQSNWKVLSVCRLQFSVQAVGDLRMYCCTSGHTLYNCVLLCQVLPQW